MWVEGRKPAWHSAASMDGKHRWVMYPRSWSPVSWWSSCFNVRHPGFRVWWPLSPLGREVKWRAKAALKELWSQQPDIKLASLCIISSRELIKIPLRSLEKAWNIISPWYIISSVWTKSKNISAADQQNQNSSRSWRLPTMQEQQPTIQELTSEPHNAPPAYIKASNTCEDPTLHKHPHFT